MIEGSVHPPGRRIPANHTIFERRSKHTVVMGLSVLVVDDDEGFRGLARRILTECGYRVEGEARNVSDALTQMARHRTDVVLLDVGLPDGDGLELSRLITTPPSTVRVVLVSADCDATSAHDATDAGATGFVPKSELSCGVLTALLHTG
ncbi:response regulator [Lacisediminihabitans sp. H27-G8]|uniref:response regulator n=1 Tax=Lacisediminihabitans sp. H27-G8 TaxID=3111909 RepID=UPI0038FC8811